MTAKRSVIFAGACCAAVLLWPSTASAQRRGRPVIRRPAVRTSIVIGGGYYRPYYYSPFLYSGFYDPFYLGWDPYYAQYPPYRYGYSRSWASVRLEIKPREAQVYVDGYYVGVVDQFDGIFQRLDMPLGEHEISVYLPGYRTYRQRTLFRPGQGYDFKVILEPLPPGAQPEPKPEPSPRAAEPNRGEPYGREPYGDQPYRQPPPPGERGRAMPPPPRPGDRRGENGDFGTLNIRVQPADAVVVIDGERWDSPEGGSRLSVQLPAGSHRVEVSKEGFRPYAATIQIRPGEPQTLNVSLPQG